MKRTIVRLAFLTTAIATLMIAAPPRALPTEAAGPGTWTATAPLPQKRWHHTATLLPNGQVLVLGGSFTCCPYMVLDDALLFNPAANSWTPTTSMPIALESHSATLLRDGRVLVVGGTDEGGFMSVGTYIYDPALASWTNVADHSFAHAGHQAVLLADGRVLVDGGPTGGPAEVYDPAGNTWTVTPGTPTAEEVSLTLLADGRVLSAGGVGGLPPNTSAHVNLFDPITNTWSAAADMSIARRGHTATLLPTGKVLVVGGYSGVTAFATAELYDPVADAWLPAGSMSATRTTHTATLLGDGRLLVAGGSNPTALSSADLYDASTNTWSDTGSMTLPRALHVATLLADGRVLVLGGTNSTLGGPTSTSTEIYDPTRWRTVASPAEPRLAHTATLLQSGKVLVAGGGSANAELYDEATDTWSAAGTMSAPREGHSAALLKDGRVLVVGGSNGPNTGVNHLLTAEIYSPSTNSWTAASNPSLDHVGHSAALLSDGRVLVYGGAGAAAAPEIYSPGTNTWTVGANNTFTGLGGIAIRAGMRVVTADLFTSSIYDPITDTWIAALPYAGPPVPGTFAQLESSNKIALTGGSNLCPGPTTISSNATLLFDSVGQTWALAAGMPGDRSSHSATGLYSGDLLVAGGSYQSSCGGPFTSLGDAQLYHPATNTWTAAGSLGSTRFAHTATRLPSGNVLIVGGTDGVAAVPSSELYDTSINTDTDGDGYNDGLELALGQHPFLKCGAMRADINYDGIVNSGDALRVAVEFGKRPPRARVDQNADKIINSGDQLRVAVNAGKRVLQCA